MALNRSLVGNSYPATTTAVTLDAIQKYARAYGDDNARYFEPSAPSGIIAPPMFTVVVTWLALITAISDPDLRVDVMRLLHTREDIRFFMPIRPGDQIAARASIIAVDDAPAGEVITIGLDASNQHQQTVSRSRFMALIRGRRGRDSLHPGGVSGSRASRSEPVLTVSQSIDFDQTARYADASGDHNPIHLDAAVARMAGLPGIIVHGLCTMALTSKVIISHLCAGDPTRLTRLAVSFSRPVFPGDRLTTNLWREDEANGASCFSYEICNAAGAAVLRDGVAEVSP